MKVEFFVFGVDMLCFVWFFVGCKVVDELLVICDWGVFDGIRDGYGVSFCGGNGGYGDGVWWFKGGVKNNCM